MSSFPVSGILPKDEIGVSTLLAQNPTWDGRGQIIAVLDQGCDPGAAGLRLTSEGKPKIIDILDTTGSGDVDTSKEVKIEIDSDGKNFITGLTGRKLMIPNDWTNPSQTFNIGIIDLTRIFPSYLKKRLTTEQKNKIWSPEYNKAQAETIKNFNSLEKIDVSNLENFLKKESAKEEVDHLKKLGTDWKNLYFQTDLLIWNDGNGLNGCLDSTFSGDLVNAKVMADYAINQEWNCLSSQTCLNYSFKIPSATLCSVVCPSGSHGSHVAGIAAAYHPDEPEKNGIAPGAQILSIKIGDSRLDTLETHEGLLRAIRAVVKAGAHVANYSYGEPVRYPLKGSIFREIKEAYLKHHMLFVTSAGNSGPALTTVGAPASISEYLMSVGAYAAPSTHCPVYSMRSELPEMNYTWSSRGPTSDGGQGVNVCAPGVAITSVPTATLQNNQLMNGTSMASPSAAGAVAVALSAINTSDKQSWSPAAVKRAFMNSARSVAGAEKETQGSGLIQVEKAISALATADKTHYDLHTAGGQRGIYLREPYEINCKKVIAMSVKAQHQDNVCNEDITAFEKHCLIKNNHSWINAPSFLHLSSGEKAFAIEVDPTQVPSGTYRSVLLDVVESGAENHVLFKIPITVVRPKEVSAGDIVSRSHLFSPGEIQRNFYTVPQGATMCTVTLSCLEAPGRYMFHALQLQKGKPFEELNREFFTSLNQKNAPTTESFKVVENGTIEITLARFWSSDGHGGATWDIRFTGVKPDQHEITLSGRPVCVALNASVSESVQPKVELSHMVIPVNPVDFVVTPLELLSYDKPLDDSLKTYQSNINYTFTLASKGDILVEVPLLDGLLYESNFSSLVHIYDSNNKRVATCEVLKLKGTKTNLEKGDYKMVVELASANKARMETISKTLVVNILFKLTKSISVETYWCQEDAMYGRNKNKDRQIFANEPVSLFIGPNMTNMDQADLAKVEAGRSLIGTMTLAKDEKAKKCEKYSINMTLVPKPKAKVEEKPKLEKDNSIVTLEREQRIIWAKAGHGGQEFYDNMKPLYPESVPLYHARLQFLTKDAKDGAPVTGDEIESVIADILKLVDIKSALFESGRKGKLSAEEQKIKDAATEEKQAWILANVSQVRINLTKTSEAGDNGNESLIKELKGIQMVTDFTAELKDLSIIRMNIEIARKLNLPGMELKNLKKLADIKDSKLISEQVGAVYKKLEWSFAEEYQGLVVTENFPHKQLLI